ncbi:hypothetical protein ABKV41_14640 [Enterobacter roggenkampii]|uniref:hypothetical protein n=1 Tax=Enterobacter roggenkampii TaxID=1812935 RepID=UPI0032B01862
MEFTKDPSTHPANGPLTEERLIRVRDELAAAAKRSDGGNLGYMMADAAKAIDEVLTLRKAGQEPVAWRYRTTDINGNPNLRWSFSEEASLMGLYQPLYAAPQLPQPVPNSVANTFIAAIEKEQDRLHGEDYLMDSRDCIDVIREELQRLNACRAACYISCRYL